MSELQKQIRRTLRSAGAFDGLDQPARDALVAQVCGNVQASVIALEKIWIDPRPFTVKLVIER